MKIVILYLPGGEKSMFLHENVAITQNELNHAYLVHAIFAKIDRCNESIAAIA